MAAELGNCTVVADWRDLLHKPELEAVIVATTHNVLAEITMACLDAGKHVLVEKPGARNAAELKPVVEKSARTGLVVKVGFSLRFHPALLKAREIFKSGVMGPLMFIRGRYGHGGRIGYEKEWRANPAISGGGSLIDQGVHLIDLSRLFLGDFSSVEAYLPTYYWDMPVEDNAFLLLRTGSGQAAWLHATCTEWKNMFSMEIYGRKGKIQIDGIGGSYGEEQMTYYQMLPGMGPPRTSSWTFEADDNSWALEIRDFIHAIDSGCHVNGGLADAQAALEILEKAYAGRNAKTS